VSARWYFEVIPEFFSSASAELSDTWKRQMEAIDRKWKNLQETAATLSSQTQAANKRVHDVQSSPLSAAKDDPTLKKL